MKQVWKIGVMAGLLALGVAAQAEALISVRLIACQGTICASTTIAGPSASETVQLDTVQVGDYLINAQGSGSQFPAISFASETSISVVRNANTSATALTIWVEATGYDTPTSPTGVFVLDTTHTATVAPTGPGALVTWQAWLSASNTGTGYVGNTTPAGVATTAPSIPAGSFSNGAISCNPNLSCNVEGNAGNVASGNPFALVTRTTFDIAQGDTRLYTSGSQAFVVAAVPEPASMLLLGTGLVGLAAVARRRRKNAK